MLAAAAAVAAVAAAGGEVITRLLTSPRSLELDERCLPGGVFIKVFEG